MILDMLQVYVQVMVQKICLNEELFTKYVVLCFPQLLILYNDKIMIKNEYVRRTLPPYSNK